MQRRCLTLLLVFALAVHLGWWVYALPRLSHAGFRLVYSSKPVAIDPWPVKEGMTEEEVLALVGPPHKRVLDPELHGAEFWAYFTDSLTLHYHGISFSSDGRVKATWLAQDY